MVSGNVGEAFGQRKPHRSEDLSPAWKAKKAEEGEGQQEKRGVCHFGPVGQVSVLFAELKP